MTSCLFKIGLMKCMLKIHAVDKIYFQVTESMNDQSVRERELASLKKIPDNYEKIVLAGECAHPVTCDGIKIIQLTDFLLEGQLPLS